MIRFQKIDPEKDKSTLLEIHCEIIYASDTSWAREIPYYQYRTKWLSTSQPKEFLNHLSRSMQDPRTLAEYVINENEEKVGYVWVVFHDIADYGLVVAEIMDFYVFPPYRRSGLGKQILRMIEDRAGANGANVLRSETGKENIASIHLHKKSGFQIYRVLFEKKLEK